MDIIAHASDITGPIGGTPAVDLDDIESLRAELQAVTANRGAYGMESADVRDRIGTLGRIAFLAGRLAWLEAAGIPPAGIPATTYQPNDDYGAQHIAFINPGGTATCQQIVGWGNRGEGWGGSTPVTATPGGPRPLPFHPGRTYAYGVTAADAMANLRSGNALGGTTR